LNKELIVNLNKINALNDQIKNKDVFINTLKKNINNLKEKLSSTEKFKHDFNAQARQIIQTESETNMLKTECM